MHALWSYLDLAFLCHSLSRRSRRMRTPDEYFKSVSSCTTMNRSVFIDACMESDLKEVESLLAAGVNPNVERDNRGRSAMHIAAFRGRLDMLKKLKDYGGDFTQCDFIGNTTMHMCNSVAVIQFLVRNGVDPCVRNNNGDTPLNLAVRFGAHPEVLDCLRYFEQRHHTSRPEGEESLMQYANRAGLGFLAVSIVATWREFSSEMGCCKLTLFFLLAGLISLYIAFIITGIDPLQMKPLMYQLEGH